MAAPMAISPTRMELIKLRKRISLAQRGHDLLTEKMDALVIEFFEILKRVRRARADALTQLATAHRALSICLALVGTIETRQASIEARREIQLEASTRHVMGIETPALRIEGAERRVLERGYGIHFTSSALDDAAREFEKALGLLVELAELEESMRAIARELEKTKRRANALEYIIIPRLKATIKFIMMRLDEMERENFSRLKRIKAMLGAGA
jgi:V/A-type H+-transporting ATPase subunit D